MGRIMAREGRPDWSVALAIFFAVVYLVLWVAGQVLLFTITAGGGGSNPADFLPGQIVFGSLIGSLALIFGIITWARRRMVGEWLDGLKLRQPRNTSIFLIILVGLAAAWTIDLIGVLTHLKGDQPVPIYLAALVAPISLTWIIAAIFAIVIQPLAEGLVFYGILYPALANDQKNNLWVCLIVAILYTVGSAGILAVGDINWFALVQPFLMTFVVAVVRAYSKSTYSAIIARSLFGLFFVLAALISARY